MDYFDVAYDTIREVLGKPGITPDCFPLPLLDGIHQLIAVGLGYRIQEPTNFSTTHITTSLDADPYDRNDRDKFIKLPDYLTDFHDAMEIAPEGCELVLEQKAGGWTAAFRRSDGKTHAAETAPTAAMAVALAGLRAGLEAGPPQASDLGLQSDPTV